MFKVTNAEMLEENMDMDNHFLGDALPIMKNSEIIFSGSGNTLFCEEGVNLVNCKLCFNANNSLIYLSENSREYHLSVTVHNNCVFYMGKNNYINDTLHVILSESKHCFIGDNCLFSFGIWIRNADPHLIYNCEDDCRVNLSKSVFIGDHVWIGQSAMILKGTEIDSGSIIGAMSLVSGKKIPHNQIWAGNPCSFIKKGIFWDFACVHRWKKEQTKNSHHYKNIAKKKDIREDSYKFSYNEEETISYKDIDRVFSTDTDNIINYLSQLSGRGKNRFVHLIDMKKRKKSFFERMFTS